MPGEKAAPTYLGDGVYASFDGFQVWLHVGSHEAPAAVALDPSVIKKLNAYFAVCTGAERA